MTRDLPLALLHAALPDLRLRYGVVRVGLFGSVARDEAGPGSDVDLVAEFAVEAKLGLFELFALERDLSELLGRRATIAALSRLNLYVRASAERDLSLCRVKRRPPTFSKCCARSTGSSATSLAWTRPFSVSFARSA